MTARDEAIDAMCGDPLPAAQHLRDYHGRHLDAIPPNVLARLAIDEGGLERYVVASSDPDTPPLYRVVEP